MWSLFLPQVWKGKFENVIFSLGRRKPTKVMCFVKRHAFKSPLRFWRSSTSLIIPKKLVWEMLFSIIFNLSDGFIITGLKVRQYKRFLTGIEHWKDALQWFLGMSVYRSKNKIFWQSHHPGAAYPANKQKLNIYRNEQASNCTWYKMGPRTFAI